MTTCMDPNPDAFDWEGLFSDDLMPELAFTPPLPAQPSRLPSEAGVSTPDQCSPSPSAMLRLAPTSDPLPQQQFGALAGSTGWPAQPIGLDPCVWQGPPTLPAARSPIQPCGPAVSRGPG